MPKQDQSNDQNFKIKKEFLYIIIHFEKIWCYITISIIIFINQVILMVIFSSLKEKNFISQ